MAKLVDFMSNLIYPMQGMAAIYGLFLTISYGYELFPIFKEQLSKLQRTVGETNIKGVRRG